MFIRYLGGGIGHLEQFPPADNNDKEIIANDNHDMEVETDDFIVAGSAEDSNDNESEEDEEAGENENVEEDNNSDLGEWSDEETGNVY